MAKNSKVVSDEITQRIQRQKIHFSFSEYETILLLILKEISSLSDSCASASSTT
jgi:hypothetical protein